MATTLTIRVVELANAYVLARDRAQTLRLQNAHVSVNASAGSGSPDGPSGVAHRTPLEVIDAVAAWKRAAIDLAEHVAGEILP